jgi:hypothetical protein
LLSDAIRLAQAAEANRISRTRATGALKQDVGVPKTLLPRAPPPALKTVSLQPQESLTEAVPKSTVLTG